MEFLPISLVALVKCKRSISLKAVELITRVSKPRLFQSPAAREVGETYLGSEPVEKGYW